MKKITKIYGKYINIWLKFFNVLRYFQESDSKAHLKGKKKKVNQENTDKK